MLYRGIALSKVTTIFTCGLRQRGLHFRSPSGLVILLFASFLDPVFANAQQLSLAEQGMLPYRSYEGGDIDSISTVNGSLTLQIPLLSYPQRGGKLKASFSLYYDNPRLQPNAVCNGFTKHCMISYYDLDYGQLVSSLQGGVDGTAMNPRADFPIRVSAVLLGTGCCPNGVQYYQAQMADGAIYDLGQLAANGSTYRAVNASGLVLTSAGTSSQTLVDRDGVTYGTRNSNPSIEDSNGNLITATSSSATGWIDTMGRSIPSPTNTTSTTDLSHCPSSATSATLWSPPGASGGSSQFKYCWASIAISFTPPDCTAANSNCQPTSTTATEMVGLVLPNLTSWGFSYDNFGELTNVTFPTGGTISYTWNYINGTCYAPIYVDFDTGANTHLWPYGRAVASRTVDAHDGTGPHTWKYAVSLGQTTVTDPNGNDTVHINTNLGGCSLYETELDRYSGTGTNRTLLHKIQTTYQYDPSGGSLGFGNIVTNVLPTQITTTDVLSGKTSQVKKTYDSGISLQGGWGGLARYGEVLTQTETDFGNGSPGNALRQTSTKYMALSGPNSSLYLGANLISLPYTVQVNDGSGNQVSLTQYNYDETPRASSGLTSSNQFDPNYGVPRGNNTSVLRWFNSGAFTCPNGHSGGSGGYLISTKTYFDDGMLHTSADPCGDTTTYSYDLKYWGALLTTSTNALNQNTTNAYDFNMGLLTSTTDPNKLPTNYGYDSMSRIVHVAYPDGGSTTYCYTDGVPANCPSGDAGSYPFAVVVTKATSLSMNDISTAVVDGLGRLSQTQLNSDELGVDYTATTYDALGRKYQVYNPTRCSSITTNCDSETSWGFTSYAYDPLNRVTQVTEQDGSLVKTSYDQVSSDPSVITGICSTVSDEAGNTRQSCVDGLGRMTGVFENPSGLKYETDYSYDALNNLTGVTQKGSSGGAARVRSFTYDSLSHLVCAANPEVQPVTCPSSATLSFPTGAITYSYDPIGNVVQRKSPLPNQTGTSQLTTNYTYDSLNRLIQKSYGGISQTTINFGYDGALPSGCTPTSITGAANLIGRRSSMCDGVGSAAWSYDQIGRVLTEQHKIKGVMKQIDYSYWEDGELLSIMYPDGKEVTFTPRGNGLPGVVTDGDSTFQSAFAYAPNRALSSLSIGPNTNAIAVQQQFYYNNRFQQAVMYAFDSTNKLIASYCYDFHMGGGGTVGDLNVECNFSVTSPGDNGNLYQVVNNIASARTANYSYDALNRIQKAYTNGPSWGEAYVIDAWGNLTNINPISGKTNHEPLAAPALPTNQLTGFTYDAAGNLINDGAGNTYTYDAENRLATAGGVTYSYDGDGNRVVKSNGTIYWRGLGDDVLAESNLSGAISEEYVYVNGKRMLRMDRPNGADHLYFSDIVGSTTLVTDINGNPQEQSDYYPFGGEIPISGSDSNHYKFTGKERDAESCAVGRCLDYFGARYYTSAMGRFMTPDWAAKPIAVPYANYGNPQSLNLYAYVENNPTTTGDPDGHSDAGTFCSAECRARYAQYAAEHPVAATLEPIAEFGTIPTAMIGGSAAWGSVLLRNLLGLGLATAPRWEPIVVDAIDGYVNPSAGGRLTIASGQTKLSEEEISTGVRLAQQTGEALAQGSHAGEEFVDSFGRTYDAVNSPSAYANWASGKTTTEEVLGNIKSTAVKDGLDFVAVDLKGASKAQTEIIKDFVKNNLTKTERNRIIYVNQ